MTSQASQRAFKTTRWSPITHVIGGRSGASAQALDELAVRYRFAVYAHVRRCGHASAIALDITRSVMRHLPRHFQIVDRSADTKRFRRLRLERLNEWLALDWRETRDETEDALPAIGDAALNSSTLRWQYYYIAYCELELAIAQHTDRQALSIFQQYKSAPACARKFNPMR